MQIHTLHQSHPSNGQPDSGRVLLQPQQCKITAPPVNHCSGILTGAISPAEACAVAKSTYVTNMVSRLHTATASKVAGPLQDFFEIAGGETFTGVTGADRVSNFGYAALGKTMPRQGGALIAVRGTEFKSANDWLTNANCARVVGKAAEMVESLVRQIMRSLGMTVAATLNITAQFLRWILGKLFAVVSAIARIAIQRLNA